MDAAHLVDTLRIVALVVDSAGVIVKASGGFGGFFDIDIDELPGTSVFEHVAPDDVDELALYFIENVTEQTGHAALPMSFRMSIVDSSGFIHPVDIIPTGVQDEAGEWWWTVAIVPVSLNGSITRSLDLEMAGASRQEVRRMLCEELLVDNESYTSRWLLIDLADPRYPDVVTSRDGDREIADAVESIILAVDWKPWDGIPEGRTEALDVSDFPEPLAGLMADRGWQRSLVSPVYVDGRLVAAYLMVGAVPHSYPANDVKVNVASRVQTLVRATAMLIAKWHEHDELMLAARTDSLTGLANRDAFFAGLESESRVGALLYIDVDHFKSVNDGYGHEVGDQVLITVAERIASVCRQPDLVARFGGDEFVVLLRRATADVAQNIARRIVDAMSAPLDIAGGPDSVSVSIGLSMVANGDNPLDAADQALLSAKRGGRGRVACAFAPAAT